MEEELRNISNSSTTTCQALPDPGFTAFVIVLAVTLVLVILLNGLIAIMLLWATSVAIQVRILVVNLLVAILIVAVVWLCVVLYSLALALGYASEPSLPFCRFAIFVFAFTVQGRILGLTLLSAMVLQPVACGTAENGAKWSMYSLAPCWVIAFILTFHILMPETFSSSSLSFSTFLFTKPSLQHSFLFLATCQLNLPSSRTCFGQKAFSFDGASCGGLF